MYLNARVYLITLSSAFGIIIYFFLSSPAHLYYNKLHSKNINQIEETDQLKDCDRRKAIEEYKKLFLVETDIFCKNYLIFMMKATAYVHNLYSIDSIIIENKYEPSIDEYSKILFFTDSLLYANNDKLNDADPYVDVIKKFPLIENIYYFSLGLYYKYDQPNDKKALEYFSKSIDSHKIHGQHRIFAILANNEAIQTAFNEREYILAHTFGENAFKLSLYCQNDSLSRTIGFVARGYGIHTENKAKCINDLKNAKVLSTHKDVVIAHQEILKLLTYYNFGRDSLEFKKYKTEYINSSKVYGDNMNINRSLGYFSLMEGNFHDALNFYTKSLNFYNNRKRYDPTLLLTAHLFLSECYKGLGDFNNAINERLLGYKINFMEVPNLNSFLNTLKDSIIRSNPTINYILGYDISEILTSKYEISKNISDLELALEFMEISLTFKFDPILSLDKTKELIVFDDYAQYYTNKAIPMIYRLYDLTKKQEYLNKYLELICHNRAKISGQKITEAYSKFKVPTKIIRKEKYLNSRLSMVKMKQNFDNDSLKYWVEELKNIYDFYNINFPEYLRHIKNVDAKPISYFKEILKTNEKVIQYDIVQNNIYIFYIGKNEVSLIKRPYNKKVIEKIQDYQSGLKDMDDAYYFDSYEIYSNLIPKEVQTAEKIYIVADDDLHRLSFDALCIDKNKKLSISKHEFVFLLNIDRLTMQVEENNIVSHKTALFAFSDPNTIRAKNTKKIPELVGSFKEVKNIALKYNMKNAYYGTEATLNKFKLEYQNPEINHLHLAVHGFADGHRHGFAYLLFRNSKTVVDTLYTYDLESMSSLCKTVVLSGCQTNYGKVLTQEGSMTIARAFLMNGAIQVLSTLWPVDDIATSRIMSNIYLVNQPISSKTLSAAKLQMHNTGKYKINQWAGLQFIR